MPMDHRSQRLSDQFRGVFRIVPILSQGICDNPSFIHGHRSEKAHDRDVLADKVLYQCDDKFNGNSLELSIPNNSCAS
jgi:hypothetical protein